MRNAPRSYLFCVMLSLDRFLNAILGGHHLETISGRLGKLEAEGSKQACYFCKLLSLVLLDFNHCVKQYRWERMMIRRVEGLKEEFREGKHE